MWHAFARLAAVQVRRVHTGGNGHDGRRLRLWQGLIRLWPWA